MTKLLMTTAALALMACTAHAGALPGDGEIPKAFHGTWCPDRLDPLGYKKSTQSCDHGFKIDADGYTFNDAGNTTRCELILEESKMTQRRSCCGPISEY